MDSTPDYRALCAEKLPELRRIFQSILSFARSPRFGPTVGNIELADRLIDAVVSWSENSLPHPEPEGPTYEDRIKAAFAMGQTGAPSSETERLAFESWMRGHSWLVEGVWNGTTYDDRGPSRVSSVDVGAMQTRMLWAAWRDSAALTCLGRPAVKPVPVSEPLPVPKVQP